MQDLDRLKAQLARLLAPLLTRLDYSCFYSAIVVAQNGDGSLELKSTAAKLPNLSRVAVRYGIPGVSATLKPGGNVIVGFENADPTRPFCLVWDMAAVQSISFLGGTRPAARVGDVVQVVFPPLANFTGTVNGLPALGVVVFTQPAPGIIQTGNGQVLA